MKLSRYFIPSEHNEYKPWFLTTQALVVFCVVIWGLRLILPSHISEAAPTIDPTDLMNRINAERTQRFIPALNTNDKLITAATGKASDMLARSYFAHVDPDGNYVWPRIEAAGYTPYLTLGENLAMDFTDAGSLMDAWMNSPTHRENIENTQFQDQGLASIYGTFAPGHDTIMVTSLFGTLYLPTTPKPKTPATATTPPNTTTKTAPAAAPKATPSTSTPVQINSDPQISETTVSGHTLINIDAVITGKPSLVTAKLKSQAITLLAASGPNEFVGSFTFDPGEDLANQTMQVEARNSAGTKTDAQFGVNFPTTAVAGEDTSAVVGSAPNPVGPPTSTNDTQVIEFLRIAFGVFALIYVVFLIVDAIIIHRAKVKRPDLHQNMHILLFILIASVALFTKW